MSAQKNILITDRFSVDALAYLNSLPHLNVKKTDSPNHLPPEELAKAHALLIRSKTNINEDLLKKARNLQVIITGTSGFDHIDLHATTKWGITVMNTPDANIESAAGLTWSLILAIHHQLLPAVKMANTQNWNKESIVGKELSGRTLGIIGLGRIGTRVAQIGKSLGMQVCAYDPYQEHGAFDKLQIERLSLAELMKTSDVASLHVPLTQETEGMIHEHLLENSNRQLVLINCSRGAVVKESALIQALENSWIAAAGLDVFEKEPLATDSRLFQFPQILKTPHIGANTEDAFHKASSLAAEKLVKFLFDGSTSDTLPPRAPWYGATKAKT